MRNSDQGGSVRYIAQQDSDYANQWGVFDTKLNYWFRRCGSNEPWANQIADEQNKLWDGMISATEHRTHFGVSRRGGRTYGHQGGHYRESTASCSCGWSAEVNGQTYVESVQEAREHLKEMEVYTTPLEQTVYSAISPQAWTVEQITERSGKTPGRVKKVLNKLIERGNVIEPQPGTYQSTDKWFSWND